MTHYLLWLVASLLLSVCAASLPVSYGIRNPSQFLRYYSQAVFHFYFLGREKK